MTQDRDDPPAEPVPFILCLDDDASQRIIVKTILMQTGKYDCVTVATSEEALRIMRTQPVDVLVQDLDRCGRLVGEAFCRVMKADEELRRIPIIIASGFHKTMPGVWEAYIEKPYTHRELTSLLKAVLAEFPPRR